MADPMPEVTIEFKPDVEMGESIATPAADGTPAPAPAASGEASREADEVIEVQEPAAPVVVSQQGLFLSYLKSPIVYLVLGKDEEQTVLTAHQAILESSPYLAEKIAQFEEGGERRINLEDEYTDAVACFLQFQYTGDYFPRLISKNSLESDPGLPNYDPVGEQLLKHARIYTLAEKYGVHKLRNLAYNKIHAVPSTALGEVAYARYVYSQSSENDANIRRPIAWFWAKSSNILRPQAENEFRTLCIDYPQFSFDVLDIVLKEQIKPVESTTNSPAHKGPGRKRSRAI
ncbi:hypothetical protein FQN49_000628 [Arthroderma sp. PD_2]|nr:hypothetical protein FQN49_000628 [Arthroderma sp. PD_2]